MKSLAIFDLDGTLIKGQTQRLFIKIVKEKGWISSVDYALLMLWFTGYKLRFFRDAEKVRELACRKFEDFEVTRVHALINEYFSKFSDRIYPEAYGLIEKHRQQGDELLVISSSIEPIVKSLCRHFGIGNYISTRLEERKGVYTGKITGKATYGTQKAIALQQYLKINNLRNIHTVYYADHISDLPLLLDVKEPICVNPHRKLRTVAKVNNWQVINTSQ